jgi:hypothetical protein
MLLNESSGTDVQPRAWAMPQGMQSAGGWRLMFMGQAFVTNIQQYGVDRQPSGPMTTAETPETGLDKLYSTNWGMLAAVRRAGPGALMLRTMLSLEPATISDRRYPELFQTGETAYGAAIVDGQHPHNFVMEIAAEYVARVNKSILGYIYYAPVGDPALGPTAYPHRASAAELPQAALGHHYEDSTHIAYDVATVGVDPGWARLEASGFHGEEPGENRWSVPDGGFVRMDSWAVRGVVSKLKAVTAQVSTGRLTHPEAASAGDIERTTASVEYARRSSATSVIWGRDYKTDGRYSVNAVTAETVLAAGAKNLFTGRYEWSQRDELFDNEAALKKQFAAEGQRWFDIGAYTAGYTRVVGNWHDAEVGVGGNVTAYSVPGEIQAYYGAHPVAVSVYLRVRLKGKKAMAMDCC